jgi:hypothetical protein
VPILKAAPGIRAIAVTLPNLISVGPLFGVKRPRPKIKPMTALDPLSPSVSKQTKHLVGRIEKKAKTAA